MKKNAKPFGLQFLTEVEQQHVNGGKHKHKHPTHPTHPTNPGTGGGTFHTMAISMPSAAHPTGDSF